MSYYSPSFINTQIDLSSELPSMTTPSTSPTMSYFFGPLDRKYCMWFYYLSVFGFILFVFVLVSGIAMGVSRNKGAGYYYAIFLASLVYGVFYFQNRLLFTMCTNST